MLHIVAQSAELINSLRPDWYRVYVKGQHLRVFLGHLIVITIEGNYIWLATDPEVQPVDFSNLVSWRRDEVGLRPADAKSSPYPQYKRPPSLNGFYVPADDPNGTEWQHIATSHYAYLKRAAVDGRVPDHRTVHDPMLAEEIQSWNSLISLEKFFDNSEKLFHNSVQKALISEPNLRRQRLANAPRKPPTRTVKVRIFDRNPDVVAEVLLRANGFCEYCGAPAPFLRASDNTPYLEVHHRVRLADGGDDTVENAVALCPNCHRQQHYG